MSLSTYICSCFFCFCSFYLLGSEAVRIGMFRKRLPNLAVDLFCVYFVLWYLCISGECLLCCIRFSFFSTKPRDWLGKTSPKWPVWCQGGCETLTQYSILHFCISRVSLSYDTSVTTCYILHIQFHKKTIVYLSRLVYYTFNASGNLRYYYLTFTLCVAERARLGFKLKLCDINRTQQRYCMEEVRGTKRE